MRRHMKNPEMTDPRENVARMRCGFPAEAMT